jgi:Na+-transporting methylmalonyl-CoA/oxaloacetate decarboxylase gamma subunit
MVEAHTLAEAMVIVVAGMVVVFAGLVLIWLSISLFNWAVKLGRREAVSSAETPAVKAPSVEIPRTHLAAIGAAVELYRRLHLEVPESTVTFERGDVRTGWKLGFRFGQRQRPPR